MSLFKRTRRTSKSCVNPTINNPNNIIAHVPPPFFSFECSYHPLGLAYFPDGAHADADELEPGIVPPGSSSTCDTDMTCPAPMYYMENVYQGTYSNNADLVAVSSGEDNFGLDEYEPLFFHPLPGMLMCLFSSILQTIRFTLNSFHYPITLIQK